MLATTMATEAGSAKRPKAGVSTSPSGSARVAPE
jgi:hypothetical protein